MAREGALNAVERFAELVAGDDPALDEAALLMAAAADPDVEPAVALAELDRLADGVHDLDGLIERLFTKEGFAGNLEEYGDPRNSLLHEVLQRRLGIPISLSVVCIEVGRRAGIALEGVGMPGHFLVRPVGGQRYLDAFTGGRVLDLAGVEALFRGITDAGADVPFGPELLQTASTKAILARMLENLRVVYRRHGRTEDLEWVLRMRLELPQPDVGHVEQLAQAIAAQGRWDEGGILLDRYAGTWAAHADALQLSARSMRAHLN